MCATGIPGRVAMIEGQSRTWFNYFRSMPLKSTVLVARRRQSSQWTSPQPGCEFLEGRGRGGGGERGEDRDWEDFYLFVIFLYFTTCLLPS